MIKVDSTTTIISGDLSTLLAEMSNVLRRFYFEMRDSLGEEEANKHLVQIGRIAVMSEKELQNLSEDNVLF